MRTIVVVVLLIALASCSNIRDRVQYEYAFEQFMKSSGRVYATAEEYAYRLQVFANNVDKIELHNAEESKYKMGVNKFADLSKEEFVASRFCGGLLQKKNLKSNVLRKSTGVSVPDSVDWTTEGAVTEVKDQGSCGSCWAFSTTGSLESAYFLKNSELKSFSEQQLVDCSVRYGNMGCSGGLMVYAFDYIRDNGLCLESDYPYHGVDESCQSCESAVSISGYVEVDTTEVALAEAVAETPVSIAINAEPMQLYTSGIYDGVCYDYLNHGVLMVGYGVEDNVKFWKIKNSWGTSWGESGYFRIVKDVEQEGGLCGLAEMSSYPTL